jgi:hypothetical protein
MLRQQLLEVGLAHDEQRGVAVRVGIVRAGRPSNRAMSPNQVPGST